VCDLETSRMGAPYIYIYIYIYDISSLRVNAFLLGPSIFHRNLTWNTPSLRSSVNVTDIAQP